MSELIVPELVCLDLKAPSKEVAIRLLAEKMDKCGRLNDKEEYIQAVYDREKEFATAVGYSLAIPHGKTDAVKTVTVAFARLTEEVKWDDKEKVNTIFQIAVPKSDAGNRHLQILAGLSRKLIHEDFREQISKAKTADEIIQLIGEV
jgi:PTS system fructose-specific IIA component